MGVYLGFKNAPSFLIKNSSEKRHKISVTKNVIFIFKIYQVNPLRPYVVCAILRDLSFDDNNY